MGHPDNIGNQRFRKTAKLLSLSFHRTPKLLPFVLWLLFVVGIWIPAAQAQQSSKEHVKALGSIGMTVGDMDRALDFYSEALDFEKVSDVELAGSEFERLTGVFGLRFRVVHLKR